MDLYNLGKVSWQESQLLYHALAYSGQEALVLLSPSTPYVCIGFHQEVEAEVDLEFCAANGIPVFRREVGGGAVYLDGNQFFFQLILKKDNKLVPALKEAFYKIFLEPVINTYRLIGIPAEYKPVNDVLAGNRKISGTGVGEMGDCIVFVGNIILDFDFEMMAKVLKVPDEKFRDKVYKTLQENLTTIRKELGETEAAQWKESKVNDILQTEFGKLLGAFNQGIIDDVIRRKMNELGTTMMAPDWLHQKGRKNSGRQVKIQSGVNIIQKAHKAAGGLIRATYELRNDRLYNASLSGDFFCYPPDAINLLELKLEGVDNAAVQSTIENFYKTNAIETNGIMISDWMSVFQK